MTLLDMANRLMDKGWGEEGEDEMNGESSVEAYTLPCITLIANGNLLYDSGNLTQGYVII